MTNLIENPDEAIQNINRFRSSASAKKRANNPMKNQMNFVGHKNDGEYFFAPARFVVVKNITNSTQAPLADLTKARKTLTGLFGEPFAYERGAPENEEIFKDYEADCVRLGTDHNIDIRPSQSSDSRFFWLVGQSTDNANILLEDVEDIKRDKTVDKTTRTALISARLGQGKFRKDVMGLWDMECAVSGCTTLEVLRASHIKPWRDSTNAERLDPTNGIMLTANLDALFDRGLISFSDGGRMLITSGLSEDNRALLGVRDGCLRKKLNENQARYLALHRREHGFKGNL